MKILFVTECLGSGGAERQLVGLAVMLKSRGYDVSVLTYYNRNFYKDQLDKANIQFECYEAALNRYLRFYLLSRKANSYHADIIVSYLPGSNIALSLGKTLGLIKSKLIVSERNYTLKWSHKTKLFFYIQSKADCLVTNSEAEGNNIARHLNYFRNKQFVIQNFINSDFFVKDETVERSDNKILCVARLRNYKNVLGFLECVGKLRELGYSLDVNWYGHDYDDDYSRGIKKRILELGLSDVFKLHAPSENILEVYQKSSALCLPSFREGYPNVIIEAMSCELPIICSNVSENPNIIEEGVNGFLFNPNDIDSMVSAMIRYFAISSTDKKKMGARNREKVVNNNSMDSFVNKYIKLFETLYNK